MSILIIIIAFLLLFFGILGAFFPVIPGPPLSFFGILLISYLTDFTHITFDNLIYLAVIAFLITFLDYWLQIFSVKIFGGGKHSLIGVIVGLLFGLFIFPPFGVFLGPFFGAYLGALYETDFNFLSSLKIAFGAIVGFISGIIMKISYSIYAFWIALSYLMPSRFESVI